MNLEQLKNFREEIFKFSWSQAFSDKDGKSTILPIAAFIAVVSGCIGFLHSIWIKGDNLTMWSVTLATTGLAALMGRKIVNGKPGEIPQIEDEH